MTYSPIKFHPYAKRFHAGCLKAADMESFTIFRKGSAVIQERPRAAPCRFVPVGVQLDQAERCAHGGNATASAPCVCSTRDEGTLDFSGAKIRLRDPAFLRG